MVLCCHIGCAGALGLKDQDPFAAFAGTKLPVCGKWMAALTI
jgi:hypothetical protein